MAKKFTEIEKGTFQKLGKEYDYVVELGEGFNGKKDVRVRIIEEKLGLDRADLSGEEFFSYENKFKGPF